MKNEIKPLLVCVGILVVLFFAAHSTNKACKNAGGVSVGYYGLDCYVNGRGYIKP